MTVVLAVVLTAAPALTQAQAAPDTVTRERTGAMIASGLVGGVIGLFVGGAIGMGIERASTEHCIDFCGLFGALAGGVVGESLGMAAGVHLANGRQGSFGAALAGPLLIGGAAFLFALSGGADDIPAAGAVFTVVVPTAQLAAAIAGEKRAARR